MTDVALIVDSHAQIRSLNVELAKKTKLIDDLKVKLQHFTSHKHPKDIKQDEDVLEYMVGIVKEKDRVIEEQQFKIAQLVVSNIVSINLYYQKREQDLREKVERFEFIYDGSAPLNRNDHYSRSN